MCLCFPSIYIEFVLQIPIRMAVLFSCIREMLYLYYRSCAQETGTVQQLLLQDQDGTGSFSSPAWLSSRICFPLSLPIPSVGSRCKTEQVSPQPLPLLSYTAASSVVSNVLGKEAREKSVVRIAFKRYATLSKNIESLC